MRNLLLFQRLLALAAGLWLLGAPAAALIIAVDDRAGLTFRAQDVPKEIAHGSYSCFIWLHPEQTHDRRRRLYSIPGGVKITLEPGSGVRATLLTTGVEATAPATLTPGRWALIAVSRDRATGRLDVWAGSDGSALEHGWFEPGAAAPGLGPADPLNLPPPEPWRLGAWGAEPGIAGAFGLVVLRIHAVGDADVREIWNSRRLFAPYEHDNRATGGRMTGWSGGIHMVGHAITTSPIDGGAGGEPQERAAFLGAAVTPRNVHIVNAPAEPIGPLWTGFRTVRPVEEATGLVYGSRLEPPYGGFFVRDLPAASLPDWPAPAFGHALRQVATGPIHPLRIMTSGNSRGVRGSSHDGWPQNYMHGFVQLNPPWVSGVMLKGASLRGASGRWLGFDASIQEPVWFAVDPVDVAAPAYADFSRFFTATGTSARGGGSGVLIRPGGFHRLRCGPVEGTLIRAEAPLVSEAHLLRFPGSSDMLWRPDRGASQGDEGHRVGDAERVALDTTRFVHTIATGDRIVSDVTIVLAGDLTGSIRVGDACFVGGGPGVESISVVSIVARDGVDTRVTFEHPFGRAPGAGSVLRFGEWGFHTVRYAWSGIPAGDPDVWRGLELAADGSGHGVVALAMSAYRPDVPGFILGAAGWAGNGYDRQLQASFSHAPERWMAMSEADVWIQGFAQQGSTPGAMGRYADAIRRGLPDVEIVWAGDTEHGNSTFDSWHRYILDEAPARGCAALSLLLEPAPGAFLEQIADGLRADTAHYTAYGNLMIARGWTRQIETATRCVGVDLDGDGELTFFDFLEFSALYSAGDLRADFDGDGSLTFFDFLAFQEQMAACSG